MKPFDRLMCYIVDNNKKAVKSLILEHQDVYNDISFINEFDSNGESPLIKAIDENNTDIVKILINNGVNINYYNEHRTRDGLLGLPIYNRNIGMIKLLLDNGLKINMNDLNNAVRSYSIEIVQFLLDYVLKHPNSQFSKQPNDQISLNNYDENGNTPLLAVINSTYDIDMIRYLLSNGAIDSINNPNKYGYTPLLSAINFDHTQDNHDIVRLLLMNGADESINTPNNKNITPLMLAVKIYDDDNNYDDDDNGIGLVKLLILYGADKTQISQTKLEKLNQKMIDVIKNTNPYYFGYAPTSYTNYLSYRKINLINILYKIRSLNNNHLSILPDELLYEIIYYL